MDANLKKAVKIVEKLQRWIYAARFADRHARPVAHFSYSEFSLEIAINDVWLWTDATNSEDELTFEFCRDQFLEYVDSLSAFSTDLSKLVADAEKLKKRARVVELIDQLRTEEGDSVEIPNDNPDFGGPNTVIIVRRGFEEHGVSYFGDSLLVCLEKAAEDRQAKDSHGRPS